jgi:hypothetical protein
MVQCPASHGRKLLRENFPVVVGDYNVAPTDLDTIQPLLGMMTRWFNQRAARPSRMDGRAPETAS